MVPLDKPESTYEFMFVPTRLAITCALLTLFVVPRHTWYPVAFTDCGVHERSMAEVVFDGSGVALSPVGATGDVDTESTARGMGVYSLHAIVGFTTVDPTGSV